MSKKKLNSPYDLLEADIPLVFADGTNAYKEMKSKYKTHKVGYFILAPSGAGKTYFIKNQKDSHWIDGDDLWMTARAHPEGEWWLESIPVIDEIDQRSDVITVQAKKLGFWIMGASNYWLKPDVVVIPNWQTHKKFIIKREEGEYDGGATSEHLEQVKKSRVWMSRWEKEGVPIIKSVEEAVNYLTTK